MHQFGNFEKLGTRQADRTQQEGSPYCLIKNRSRQTNAGHGHSNNICLKVSRDWWQRVHVPSSTQAHLFLASQTPMHESESWDFRESLQVTNQVFGGFRQSIHKLIPANAHAGASPTIQSTNHLAPKLAAFVTLDFNPRSPSDHNPDGATDAGTFISLLIRRMRCLALAIFIFTYSPKVKRRSQTNPRYLYVTQDSTRLRLNTSETS